MQDRSDFTTTLRAFMARARRSNSDLAQLTGISINTIENWTGGAVQRPRVVGDVLKLAHALALGADDATSLLRAAGLPHSPRCTPRASRAAIAPCARCSPPGRRSQRSLRPSPRHSPPPHSTLHATNCARRSPDEVGRAREIDQLVSALRRALAEERGAIISGVQGMGGIGKTELAYAIAHQLRDAFPNAQIVLNLRGSSPNPLTPPQILQAVIYALTPDAKLPDDLPALEQHYRSLCITPAC